MFPGVEALYGDRDGDLGALVGRTWDAVVDTSAYVPKQVAAAAAALRGRKLELSRELSLYELRHRRQAARWR